MFRDWWRRRLPSEGNSSWNGASPGSLLAVASPTRPLTAAYILQLNRSGKTILPYYRSVKAHQRVAIRLEHVPNNDFETVWMWA